MSYATLQIILADGSNGDPSGTLYIDGGGVPLGSTPTITVAGWTWTGPLTATADTPGSSATNPLDNIDTTGLVGEDGQQWLGTVSIAFTPGGDTFTGSVLRSGLINAASSQQIHSARR